MAANDADCRFTRRGITIETKGPNEAACKDLKKNESIAVASLENIGARSRYALTQLLGTKEELEDALMYIQSEVRKAISRIKASSQTREHQLLNPTSEEE